MKKYFSIVLISIHFGLILFSCSISTYDNYYDSPSNKKENKLMQQISKFTNSNAVKLYGELSACQYGFSFYAPNVRSSGYISFENNQNIYYPEFHSKEAKIRFSVFECQISDFLLAGKDTLIKAKDEIKYDSLKSKYYDLIYKSISAKLFTQNKCTDKRSNIYYTLFDYPSLKSSRINKQAPKAVKLYELQTVLNK
jgi:hypothetical protein